MFTDEEMEQFETYLIALSRKYVKAPSEFNTPWRNVAPPAKKPAIKVGAKSRRKVYKTDVTAAKARPMPTIPVNPEVPVKPEVAEIDEIFLVLDNAGSLT